MEDKRKYYMPAEWEPHEGTLIEWPVKASLIHTEKYEAVCNGYAQVVRAIGAFEPVTLIVNRENLEEARLLCGRKAEYLVIPHNDAWCRDNGPTFLLDQEKQLAAVNWQFNAWGEKFPHYDLDNQVAPRILEHLGVPFFNSDLILEGGSIHVDGRGTLLTTRECLLNKNRNPGRSPSQIEEELKGYLGISEIIWLNRGLYGDETDGHVDNAACFVKPGVVLIQTCREPSDPNYGISRENRDILDNSVDSEGRALQVIELPQPPARYDGDTRLTLSYLNFYMVNGGIILPVFGGNARETDEAAERIIKEIFPERKIVTVDGMALIAEGGNVHCITQQIPASARLKGEEGI